MRGLFYIQRLFRARRCLHNYLLEEMLHLKRAILVVVDHVKSSLAIDQVRETKSLEKVVCSQIVIAAMEQQLNLLIDILASAGERNNFIDNLKQIRYTQEKLRGHIQSVGGFCVELIFAFEFGEYNYKDNEWFQILNREFQVVSYRVYDCVTVPTISGKGNKDLLVTEIKDTWRKTRKDTMTTPALRSSLPITSFSPLGSPSSSSSPFQETSSAADNEPFLTDRNQCSRLCHLKPFSVIKENGSINQLQVASKFTLSSGKDVCVVVVGTFKEDYFQNFQITNIPFIRDQFKKIKNLLLLTLNVPKPFCERWIFTLTLTDILSKSINELQEKCSNCYDYLDKTRNLPLSNILKDFCGSDELTQREMIIAYFLSEEDSDMAYIGFVLIDLIVSDDNDKNKKRAVENVINTLPWFIRKKVLKSIDTKDVTHMRILNAITRDNAAEDLEVSYEARIYLMKVPLSIKKKASDKLKEVQNRSGSDSQSKAQQYLDGILRIPFGVYKTEPILSFVATFRGNLKDLIQKFVKYHSIHMKHVTSSTVDTNPFAARLIDFARQKLGTNVAEETLTANMTGSLTFTAVDNFFDLVKQLKEEEQKDDVPLYPSFLEKERWISLLVNRSFDELCLITQKLKKFLNLKALMFVNDQGELCTVKTKTKTNNSFTSCSSKEISEGLASFLEHYESRDPMSKEKTMCLMMDTFPELLMHRKRSQSLTGEFVDGIMQNMCTKWEKFQVDRRSSRWLNEWGFSRRSFLYVCRILMGKNLGHSHGE